MMNMEKHIELLGLKVKDKVTGFGGIVSCVSFDLYGCVQAIITPPMGDDGVNHGGNWFDVARLEIIDSKPVIDMPNFDAGYVSEGKKGAAEKPSNTKY